MLVVHAEGRLGGLDFFHFLQDLSNVFHVPPWHQYRVSHLFPPHQGLIHVSQHLQLWLQPGPGVVYLCPRPPRHDRKHAGELRGLSLASGAGMNVSWWPRLVFSFLPSASSYSQTAIGCLSVLESQGAREPHFLPRAGLPGHRQWPGL